MAYKTVSSLDTDKVYALGGYDEKLKKANPTSIEGFYLGHKTFTGDLGQSIIHVFKTQTGNEGIWGSSDTNSKLAGVKLGTMTNVVFKEKKKLAGGKSKKIFEIMIDEDVTIDVGNLVQSTQSRASDPDDSNDYEDESEPTPAPQKVEELKKKKEYVQSLLKK